MKQKRVAIVTPLSNRDYLTADEKISLKHLRYHLDKYDKFLVIPHTLDFGLPDFGTKRFDANKYFGSIKAHRDLLFSPIFYETFSDYEFILIYHFDSLVFSDQLEKWCDKGYDFIGPPWIKNKDAPYAGKPHLEGKVGNGGFALLKIASFLKVLKSKRLFVAPENYWHYYADKPMVTRFLNYPKKILKKFGIKNTIKTEIARYRSLSIEPFWANRAAHYYPEFKIATVETALKFGFECVPRYCYEQNNYTLPFGCHAWQKYDKEFWLPYVMK